LRRRQRETAGEDGEPAKEGLLVAGEEIVRPRDRGTEGLLTGGEVARTGREDVEASRQAGGQRGGRQNFAAGRRQFDGQGETVELAADLDDGRGVLIGQDEVGACFACPLDEKRNGFVARGEVGGVGIGGREWEGRHGKFPLAADTQRFAARHQDGQSRAFPDEGGNGGGRRGHALGGVGGGGGGGRAPPPPLLVRRGARGASPTPRPSPRW